MRWMAHLGPCVRSTTESLSSLDLGGAQDTRHTWDCALVVHLEPERLGSGKCTRRMAHLGLCPHGTPESLRSLDLGSTCHLGLWQPSVIYPLWALPTHASSIFFFFSVSFPLQSTAEQVSSNKWPLSPPHVRVEIRHWRDLQTEETKWSKGKKGELPQKWQLQQIKTLQLSWDCIWGATVDFESKYKLEQRTIWQWTDPINTAHKSSREIPRHIFIIIIFKLKKFSPL